MNKKTYRQTLAYLLIAGVLILLDQISKKLAVMHLMGKQSIALIPNVFHLQYLENRSAAFGVDPVSIVHHIFHIVYFEEHPDAFLRAKMIFFVVLTVAVLALILYYFQKIPQGGKFQILNITLTMFLAGAVGNLIDRVLHNYVVDFFYFCLIDFPIFNVADIYVTVGAFLLVVLCLFYYKEEDYELLFPKKNKDKHK